ncbi:MAG: hypothetical protein GX299_07435 [Epulopiscium sp.]|nr:hypothetical protein [Candidatus Epulonipiscium sp.]
METLFSYVSTYHILFAAVLAFIITNMIQKVMELHEIKKKKQATPEGKFMDIASVMAKCKELFPIDIIYFHGQEFRRGMKVKIITIQKKVIEGELIGKNKVDLVCVKTQNHIIAHEIEKIEDMMILESREDAQI